MGKVNRRNQSREYRFRVYCKLISCFYPTRQMMQISLLVKNRSLYSVEISGVSLVEAVPTPLAQSGRVGLSDKGGPTVY